MGNITINKGSEFKGFDIANNLGWRYGGNWNVPELDGEPFNGDVLDSVRDCAYNYYYMPELRLSDTMVQSMYNDSEGITGNTGFLGFEYICVPEDCRFYDTDMRLRYCIYALVHNKTMLQYVGFILFEKEDYMKLYSLDIFPNENYNPSSGQPS